MYSIYVCIMYMHITIDIVCTAVLNLTFKVFSWKHTVVLQNQGKGHRLHNQLFIYSCMRR